MIKKIKERIILSNKIKFNLKTNKVQSETKKINFALDI
jgi:hypothetical protein